MATLSQVTEAVYTSRFDDQTSAGADAAARALDKLGNTVEVVDERLKRTERTAKQWVATNDQITIAENKVERAIRARDAAQRALAAAPDQTDEAKARTLDALNAKVTQATAKLTELREAYAASAQASDLSAQSARQVAHGMDSATDATRRAAAAQSAFNDVLGVRSTGAGEYSRRAAEIAGFGQELDRLQGRFQPLALAQARYRADLDDLALATRSLGLSEAEVARQREGIKASFADQVHTLNGSKAAAEAAALAERKHAAEIDKLKASLTGYVAAMDPVAASLMRVEQAERDLAQARARGVTVSDAEASAVRRMRANHEDMTASTRNATGAIKLQAHEWTNLSYQLQDFVVQVGSGQGVFRPLLQQAPQATGAVGGVGNAVKLVTQFLSPFRLAVIGVTAVSGAAAIAYNSQEGALSRMQTRLRGVTSDYQAMGRSAEAAARASALSVPGLSLDNARAAQISLAQAAPRGSSFDIGALTAQAADLAAVMGTDVTAGVERFAQAMRDPVALVDELAKQNFPGMNEQLRLAAQRMVEGGQRADAFALVIGRVNATTAGAARDGMSPLGRAVDDLAKEFGSLWQSIGQGLAGPATSLVEWLTRAAREARSYREQLDAIDARNAAIARNGTDDGRAYGGIGAAGQIPFTPSVSNLTNLPEQVRTAIASASATTGVDADILARIFARGERSRQNADGSWPVSPKGAEGPFQVMPGTFAELSRRYGITGTANDPNSAALAAGYYFREQYQRFGDVPLAMGAYNAGPGRIEKVLAGQQEMPNETSAYIRRTTEGYNGTPLRITAARVEVDAPAVTARPNGFDYAGSDASRVAQSDADNRAINQALSQARGQSPIAGQDGTLATRRAGLEEAIALAERAKQAAAGNAEVQDVLTAAQEKYRASLEGMRGPQEEYLRGLSRAADSANILDPAQRAVNEAVREYEDRMRAAGQPPTDAGREATRIERLRELAAVYGAAGLEVSRSIQGQDRLAAAWGQGREAVQRLTAEEKARQVVQQAGITGEEQQGRAVALLTEEYARLATKQADNALRASNDNAQRNLDYLDRERQLIGATADERERELAAFRARQNAEASGAKDATAISEAQRLARETVDVNNRTKQLSNSWQAIPGFVEETASTIKGAIVSAIAAGEQRAISFGNVWKAVKASAIGSLIELGAINPALNYAFGGTRGTLGGIGSAISGGSGTTATGSGAGATGISGYADTGSGLLKLLRGGSGGAINTGFSWLDNSLNATAYTVGGTPISVAGAGVGALGVAGGLYGLYSGFQTGGAKGWAQGIGGAAGTIAGISTLAGIGAGSTAAVGTAAGGLAALSAVPTVGATVAGTAAAGAAGTGAAAAGVAGAGSAILGAVAAVAPYIAVIAAVAALFLPGQKPSDMTGVYLGNLATGENSVGGLGGDRYSQENRDQATAIGQQVAALGDSLKAALGVDLVPFNYSVSLGARDGLVAGYNNTTKHYNADDAGSQQMIKDITAAMIESMRGIASSEVQSIISHSGGDTETILGNLDWYNGTYKTLVAESENPVTAWQQSITALMTPIDAAITKARELGLSEEKLNEVRTRGLQALADQRTATLDALAATDRQRQATANGVPALTHQIQAWGEAAQAEVAALNEQLTQLGLDQAQRDPWLAERWRTLDAEQGALVRQQAEQQAQQRAANDNGLWDRFQTASGASGTFEGARWDYERKAAAEWQAAVADGMTDLTLLARVQAEERLAIQRDYAEQAAQVEQQARDAATQSALGVVTSLADYARSLRYGDTSTLSYRDQYALAGSSLDAVGSAAVGGDWNSIQRAQTYMQEFLSASRAVNGSGAQYANDVGRVADWIERISGIGADGLTDAARTAAAITDQTQTLVTELRALRTEVVALRREQQQGQATPPRANAA
jgi:hypothetical protein